MLRQLSISDFAIIDSLDIELGLGLNVMTGETGAGKTIIVEALKLVLGGRASSEAVRAGSDSASVTAVFDASDMPDAAKGVIADAGIECGEELVIHRVVGSQGRGRISINGVPAAAATLKSVSAHLVDISSQHEHQLMLDEARYPSVLDAFAGLSSEWSSYAESHKRWLAASRDLVETEEAGRLSAERHEFLKFHLEELARADVRPGEDAEIEAELKRLKHSVFLEERTRGACELLGGDASSAAAALRAAARALEQCSQYEAKAAGWIESIDRARIEAEEVAHELSRYAEGVGSEPERAEALEERLHLVRGLVRKHGGTIESMLARRDEIRRELERIENFDSELAAKREALEGAARARSLAADSLSSRRSVAADEMALLVAGGLSELGMPKTQFAVRVEKRAENEWDDSGPDRIEFLISPNPGEPMRGLARIASGGELSRFMLALKCALLSRSAQYGTSIFDEVDSGIGGSVAAVVGKKLKSLSGERQVLCITHLPQVAAFADSHVRIAKRVKSGRTVAVMQGLAAGERVEEIARMLGGERVTETTLAHAREMIKQSGS